jgi:hypothetical protein
VITTKRDELDKLGTELWNLSTRLRRDKPVQSNVKDSKAQNNSTVCLLRAYAFLLLDSAGSQAVKGGERKSCIRLMKIALKAAKVCILAKDLENTTKVLERAAVYENLLGSKGHNADSEEGDVARRLHLEYFAMRAVLVRLRHSCLAMLM